MKPPFSNKTVAPARLLFFCLAGLILGLACSIPPAPVLAMVNGEEGEGDREKKKEEGQEGESGATSSTAKPRRPARIQRKANTKDVIADNLSDRLVDFRRADIPIPKFRAADFADVLANERNTRRETLSALRNSAAGLSSGGEALPQTLAGQYELYRDIQKPINENLRAKLELKSALLDAHGKLSVRNTYRNDIRGYTETEAAFFAAVATELHVLERELGKSASDVESGNTPVGKVLAAISKRVFPDLEQRNDVELTPLGSGGNATVYRGTPEGSNVEFAYKFETRFEVAKDAEEAGIPTEFMGGARRAQASWYGAQIFELQSRLVEARPVLLNGRPAQEMELLSRDFAPPVVEVAEEIPEAGQEAELQKYKRTQIDVAEKAVAQIQGQDPYDHASSMLVDRSYLSTHKIAGNPARIFRVVPVRLDDRLDGARSEHGFNDPTLQQQLNQLQYLDLIAGQIDRNLSNIQIRYRSASEDDNDDDSDDDGPEKFVVAQVKGIDSNLSFGTVGDVWNESNDHKPLGTLPRLPKKVDLEFAASIMPISVDDYRRRLKNTAARELTDAETDAAVARYEIVRDHVAELIESGDVAMSPGLEGADRAINVLKAKAGIKDDRQIDIWGRGGDWKAYFHENHQRFDGNTGQWIEIPTSKIGSYMARLVPTRFEGGEE